MNLVSGCHLMTPWWSLLPSQDGSWTDSSFILVPVSHSQSGIFELLLRLPWLVPFQQPLILSLNVCVWFLPGWFGLSMPLLVMCGRLRLHYLLNFSRTESPTYSLCLLRAPHTDTVFISSSRLGCASTGKGRLTPPPLCSTRNSNTHLPIFSPRASLFPWIPEVVARS